MSLARAFTTKYKGNAPENLHIGRAASTRNGRPITRSQISSPVALVSSTNSLSFEAPDIAGTKKITTYRNAADMSKCSGDESDASTVDIGSNTDASSIDNSPISTEPEPNHLSCYFKPSVDTKSSSHSLSASAHHSYDAPNIPQRGPSHSKKAHEFLHRKRSVQRMMSPPASITRRDSSEMFRAHTPPPDTHKDNPFGKELAQLDEVAEDLSHAVRDAERDEDAAYMEAHGLASYSASDYMSEIQSLIYDTFTEMEAAWI